MNDFTKDELILIKNGIQYLSDRTSLSDGYLEKCNGIENKIQSLIDSYCEHSDHHYYGDIAAAECKQCGMVMLP